jgi:hypothetical protein
VAKSLLLFALLVITQGVSHARESIIPGSRYTSARSAALGDAFLPLADDAASALFFNPAQLATLPPGFHAEPLNLFGVANPDALFGIPLLSVPGILSLPTHRTQTLSAYPNLYTALGGGTCPVIHFGPFAIGLLYQSEFGAQASPIGTYYRARYEFVPTAGFGLKLARGIVRIGYSLQWVNEAQGEVTTANLAANYWDNLNRGSGFSHTLALSVSPPVANSPEANIVVRNLLPLVFSGTAIIPLITGTAAGVPTTEPMSLDASFSLAPSVGRGNQLTIVAELRDVFSSTTSILTKLAVGMEFNYRRQLYLAGGLSSLFYPTFGFGIQGPSTRFGLSWYSEPVGTATNYSRNIKFMLQMRMGF